MSKEKQRFLASVCLCLVLGFVAGLIFTSVSGAEAAGGIQYKVVDLEPIPNNEAFEEFLNEMGSQGWQLDHVIALADVAIFQR